MLRCASDVPGLRRGRLAAYAKVRLIPQASRALPEPSPAKAGDVTAIYLPRELEFIKEGQRRRDGIPLSPKVVDELRAIGKETGVLLG